MNESEGDSLSPIIKVNPQHKKLVVWLLLVILVLGFVILAMMQPYLENWVNAYQADLPQKSREELLSDYKIFTSLVAIGMMTPLALLGTVFLYQGYRVYESNQYPYPRMMILRDTPLETGAQARRRGRRFLIVGVCVLLSGCFLGWYLYANLMRLPMPGDSSF